MDMKWDFGAVAFLDILGFSSFIDQDAKSVLPIHLERIRESIAEAKAEEIAKHLELRAFSDSIILSTDLSTNSVLNLFHAVVRLQQKFISRGVLVRGGVAFGKHYADSDLIYSEGLVAAYKLERDTARFPRVVASVDILDWLLNHKDVTEKIKEEIHGILLKDRDGLVFLNYMEPNLLPAHLKLLNSYNAIDLTASVLEKLRWLADFHNFYAKGCNPDLIFDGAGTENFRSL